MSLRCLCDCVFFCVVILIVGWVVNSVVVSFNVMVCVYVFCDYLRCFVC